MRAFGDLEAAVMERLWSWEAPATVREVLEDLTKQRPLAYTTVLTVMDNLHRKGFLLREREGRAYRYRPASDRAAYAAELMGEALADSGDRVGALLQFVEHIPPAEVTKLRAALDAAADARQRRR